MSAQYTIRNVDDEIDAAIRERAAQERKSLNNMVLELLRRALGIGPKENVQRDLSDVAGVCSIDERTRAAFEEQRQIDPEIWK